MFMKRHKRAIALIALILFFASCSAGLASEGTGSITHVVLEIQGDMVIFTIGAYGSALAAGPGDVTYDYMAAGGVPVVRAVRSGDKFIGIGAYGTAFAQEGNTAGAIAEAPAQDPDTISGYLVFEGFDGAGDPILTPLFPEPGTEVGVESVTVAGVLASVDSLDETVYHVELPPGTVLADLTAAEIMVVAIDPHAVVGEAVKEDGGATWDVVVTAQDGITERTYVINVTVAFLPVHNVDQGSYYTTIQEAIDGADPGETILVSPGIYHENLVVQVEDLTIRGVGPRDEVVVNERLNMYAHSIHLQDMSFANGIVFQIPVEDGNIQIQDSNITTSTAYQSLYFYYPVTGSNVTLLDCILENGFYGVAFEKDITNSTVEIANNRIAAQYEGILFENDGPGKILANSTVTITNNQITASEVGIYFESLIENSDVTIEDNVIAAETGIALDDDIQDTNFIINDNEITSSRGIIMAEIYEADMQITDNVITNDQVTLGSIGISIQETYEGTSLNIARNTITNFEFGIFGDSYWAYDEFETAVTIENNHIILPEGNTGARGLYIYAATRTTWISSNQVNGEYEIGIYIQYVANWGNDPVLFHLSGNQVRGADNGIKLDNLFFAGTGTVFLQNNVLEDNGEGISIQKILDHSDGPSVTTISGNLFQGNNYGLLIEEVDFADEGSQLTIEANVFEGNITAVIFKSWGSYVGDLEITNNNFQGNSYGLNNTMSMDVDARFNWWGDLSGPYQEIKNPIGQGDAVSDHVLFYPWLDDPYPGGQAVYFEFPVIFNVVGENGNLIAEADGALINSGDAVEASKTVVFTALPDTDYQVKQWTVNGIMQPGEKADDFTLFYLHEPVEVQVEFERAPNFEGGSGTAADPWQIATPQQLDSVRHFLNSHFILVDDIDLGVSPWNEDMGWEPIGVSGNSFTGTFDGSNYSIFNLTIDRPDTDQVGLFGHARLSAHLMNISLIDVDVTGQLCVGGLTGSLSTGASITGSSVSGGTVRGTVQSLGGLVGDNFAGTIIDSHTTCNVEGHLIVGGLSGRNINGNITGSHATGSVSGSRWVGGLVGYNSQINSTIAGSYATGNVSGTTYSIGGLVGTNLSADINNCYSTGNVSGEYNVGGLVGSNSFVGDHPVGTMTQCYATGFVDGEESIGGLVGLNDGDEDRVVQSYYDKETTGQDDEGKGVPKTTAEMRQMETYAGWDFEEIWGINPGENDGYPFLRWQGYVHDPAGPEPPRDLPFEEDFTGVGSQEIPAGWSRTHTNWGVVATSQAGGTPPEMRFIYSPWSTDDFFLISPAIDARTAGGLQLAFKHRTSHYADDNGISYSLQVRVSTDGGSSWDTAWEIGNPLTSVGPVTVTVDLGAYQGETFHIAWVFSGNSFNITDWRIDDIFIGEVFELVDPLEDEAVAATPVSVGDSLAQSDLSGTFKDPGSGVPVPGNLAWTDGTEMVGATGQFAWTFTPDDLAAYNEITGMVLVTAVPDPHVTAVNTKAPGGRASGSNAASDEGAITITAKNIGSAGNHIAVELWTTEELSDETVVTEVIAGTIRVKVKSLDKSKVSLSSAAEIKAAIEDHKQANALVSLTIDARGIVNTQTIELRDGADIVLIVDWNLEVTLEGGLSHLRLNDVAATDVRENPSLSHRIDIFWDNVALDPVSLDDSLRITAGTVKNALDVGNHLETWRYDGTAWTDLL